MVTEPKGRQTRSPAASAIEASLWGPVDHLCMNQLGLSPAVEIYVVHCSFIRDNGTALGNSRVRVNVTCIQSRLFHDSITALKA